MAIEIERKFLLINEGWKEFVKKSINIKQGYLNSDSNRTVRVRISDEKAWLTIKSKSDNITRQEFEYIIPVDEALELIKLCEQPIIEKVRSIVEFESHIWEIDEFEGNNKGLVLAEIELKSEVEKFTFPSWLGKEVSDDKRYFNSYLSRKPYSKW